MNDVIVNNQEERVAGFWVRTGAFIIDSILVGLVQISLEFLISYLVNGRLEMSDSNNYTLAFVYYVFLTKLYGQTFGKKWLGIQVVRVDGKPLTYWGVIYREIIMKFIGAIILLMGYIMAAFRRDKRALHDLAAKTKVIYKA